MKKMLIGMEDMRWSEEESVDRNDEEKEDRWSVKVENISKWDSVKMDGDWSKENGRKKWELIGIEIIKGGIEGIFSGEDEGMRRERRRIGMDRRMGKMNGRRRRGKIVRKR